MVNASVHLKINKEDFDKLMDEANQITGLASDYMAKSMKRSIVSGAKSGKTYGNHIASAPGQSPANDTGALVRSIRVEKNKKNESTVYVDKDYAVFLEFGTSKMRARPFIIPAFLRTKKWFSDKLHRLTSGGLK